ncbi:MAG: DNA helicase RecQ [Fibrobacterota bacterium]
MKTALHTYFGYSSFRPNQQEIIEAILSGRDVFAIMPTGGGKSLCYQIPAVLLPGVTIVISPLISLMKDQVDAALDNGIAAAFFNSSLSQDQKRSVIARLHQGTLKLLYISPERFNIPAFQKLLQSFNVSLIAIDEAHCVSEWGHDFRPDYLALASLVDLFPNVPLAAFTATATLHVQEDISTRLRLRNPFRIRASFDRPNLSYQVLPKMEYKHQIAGYIKAHPAQSGIIYRTTRKDVDALSKFLRKQGIKALPYHAGLDDPVRQKHQEAFNRDKVQVIVATIAFGMGIDKSNVRFVMHVDIPKNMEGYYQETGRAGRDGEPAECILYFRRSDIFKIHYFIRQMEETEQKRAYANLEKVLHFAQSDECRRKNILAYFDEEYSRPKCDNCDICNNEVSRTDATLAVQKVLSAVQRTGNRFGAAHIVDVLVGANTGKIRQFNHQSVKTYGAGKGQKKDYWRTLMDELLAKKILDKSADNFGSIALTESAWGILKGEERFFSITVSKPAASVSSSASSSTGHWNEALFQALRILRREIADERGVPPYIVFSDKTLKEMATKRPRTRLELISISGVGEHKLKLYGDSFVAVIAEHATLNCSKPENGNA